MIITIKIFLYYLILSIFWWSILTVCAYTFRLKIFYYFEWKMKIGKNYLIHTFYYFFLFLNLPYLEILKLFKARRVKIWWHNNDINSQLMVNIKRVFSGDVLNLICKLAWESAQPLAI